MSKYYNEKGILQDIGMNIHRQFSLCTAFPCADHRISVETLQKYHWDIANKSIPDKLNVVWKAIVV